MAETGYCVKCREKGREIKDPEIVDMPAKGGNTRRAVKGVCAVCGTKMTRFAAADYKLNTD